MATTGELRAIIQELHLVDIGDAASYLGEEAIVVEESPVSVQPALLLEAESVLVLASMDFDTSDDTACTLVRA